MSSLGLCLVILGAMVLAGNGCIFDPISTHKPPITSGPEPVVQSTPENTLKQLEYAYTHRDTLLIKAVYDSTYTGSSTDLTQPPASQILNFTYVDEVEHVAALARSHSIINVSLSFGVTTRLPSDDISHPDWAVVQMPGSQVQLDIQADTTSFGLYAIGETLTFKLRPITPASTPTDTLWKIVRWQESYVGGA